MRARRPDLAPLLFEDWHWHLHGDTVLPFPICRYDGKSLATFFIGWYIRRAQKDSVILHKRTAYEDHAEPHLRRHLLRSWLAARDFEDGDELLRRGVERPATEP